MVLIDSSLLIIESSVENSAIYQDYLRSTDRFYDLSIATSIGEGLDLCRTNSIAGADGKPFDGVLLGRSVSEVDRLDFLESLAEVPNRERPFVVIVASDDDTRSAVRALKLGAQDYLLERDLTPELLQSAFQVVKLDHGLIATWREVTDRKQAELALQASERQYQAMIEQQLERFDAITSAVPDFIYTFDLSGRFTYANQSLLDLWQQSLDGAIGKNFHELDYPPELAERLQDHIQQVIATQQPLKDETPYTSFQGTRAYEYIFVPLFANDGTVEGVAGTTRDITDRKIAEAALQASEQRYKALIDITAQIVWNADANGTILTSNSGAFTGQSLEDFQDWGWMEAIHPDDRQRTSEEWFLAVSNLTPYELDHRLRRWDGEYRLMRTRAVPLLDAAGSVREWVGLHTDITEARQDEENLRRSEEFNRRILENNQDCIKVLDLEGRLVYMNDGGKHLLGIANFTDYDGSLWTHFWGGSEQELAQAAFAAATAGIVSKFEGRCPTVTGVPKWWEVSVIPLHDKDGHVEQILAISHDITEQRQAEHQLRQAQALAQRQLVEIEAIYQTAPIGLATIDLDLRFQRVNQRLAEMNGVAIEDHIGRTVRDVLGDLADGNEPLLQQVLATGEPLLNLELSGETKAHPGIYRTWISNFYPLKDRTGQIIGVNIVVQEITDRKRSEIEIRQSESKVRRVLDNLFSFVGVMTTDGTLIEANNTALRAASLSAADVLGKPFPDAYWWAYDPEIQSQLWAAIRQAAAGETVRYDVQIRLGEDQFIIIDFCLAPLLSDSGEVEFLIPSGIDITDRKQLQLDLQAQAVELTKTTALIEIRNQELHRFSHTVSHDLKAPLRGIANLATWISEDLPPTVDPDILANLDLMRSRIARMNSLIDGLLEYARVGTTSTSLATFSVEQLLAEVVDSLSIPDSFVVELPAELPPITTHPVLLSQVLANLIGNAYKHHDRADGRIQVTAESDAKLWTFRVTDDGRGIAPENQAEVFDIFKTLSGNDQNNTGIGLSIVKKLVESHGGEITLESQLGIGTTFNFTWIAEQTR